MIEISVSFLGILAATLIPAYIGLVVIVTLFKSSAPRHASAFALGIFLWYFSDTIGDSSYLGVNRGFSGGLGQAALILLFIAGLSFCLADRYGPASGEERGEGTRFILIPILVAAALSVHGFSEGAAFGVLASSTSATSLSAALGGYGPAISYVLHKVLEASMVGASYLYYLSNHGRNLKDSFRDISTLGAVFTIPSIIGMGIGYYFQFDATYVFAIATGTSIYVALKLSPPLLLTSGSRNSRSDSLKITLLLLLGFMSIYFAALFHSTSLGD